MGKYTDDEICNAAKITIKIAADYLSISPNILTLGMRNNLLPIGYAVHNEDRYRDINTCINSSGTARADTVKSAVTQTAAFTAIPNIFSIASRSPFPQY